MQTSHLLIIDGQSADCRRRSSAPQAGLANHLTLRQVGAATSLRLMIPPFGFRIALRPGATEESMPNTRQDEHEFMVAGVETAPGQTSQGIAITLVDARGGRVRLHLSTDMAELLAERVST